MSEDQVHRNNAFTRRFPHHPISKLYDLDLGYNSYYISGYVDNQLYLGNRTAPLHLLKIDLASQDTTHIKINLNKKNLPFRSAEIKIVSPYFFLLDGTVPAVFRGKIGMWEANLWDERDIYFSKAIPMDSTTLFVKSTSSRTFESILGIVDLDKSSDILFKEDLLEKQIDGVFDVDGIMVVSDDDKFIGYVYYYRNEFMIMNNDLELETRMRTIDTVRTAQISLSTNIKKLKITMNAPPVYINKNAYMTNNLMLIHSDRIGKFEEKVMHNQAAIIDIYDWTKSTYELSFYVYNLNESKLREFEVHDEYFVSLIGNSLSLYKLKPTHFKMRE
ncbi:hypothetical protein ESY86_18610 [Subsaximicrobium wynnwilliamsii]|uniref:DUF4221 domain-containing protein n=1 Tax=Subsaximicrobium wynnwilliamsii TaxID=291179 RepID=A0A5C6ZBL3_9FLAO|nr:hypothetical protein [Subsaximicrobium wynnwilliamsii]TXD81186.1 hypothetical protein ESY87_19110 [Subsaximicrobium wynnwilliamsii]TXD87003.1 hypothetical protein ESY86_18610 [Subsaximicrobium wynnwilliamsii]TXE00656.1 hypothetical protein ESY88_18910 [Subsaximicrobium wynnwilliamsii]